MHKKYVGENWLHKYICELILKTMYSHREALMMPIMGKVEIEKHINWN